MGNKAKSGRHTKGTNLVDLVKFLRKYRQTSPLPYLSPAAEELLETRIMVSNWYPFEAFLELLKITDDLFAVTVRISGINSIDAG